MCFANARLDLPKPAFGQCAPWLPKRKEFEHYPDRLDQKSLLKERLQEGAVLVNIWLPSNDDTYSKTLKQKCPEAKSLAGILYLSLGELHHLYSTTAFIVVTY